MFKAETKTHTKVLVVAAAVATLTLGAAGAASAATDTTEPTDTMSTDSMGSEPTATDHSMDSTPATMVAGSGEPTSPEAAAFCEAELAAEAAGTTEDPAIMGPAFEALVAAAPEEISAAVEAAVAAAESGDLGPAFEEPYAEVLDYMRPNCGYAELNLTGSEYAFGGLPEEVAAGPTIVAIENIGEEVHEIAFLRINDDVTLTAEELLALPEEEGQTMTTFVGIAFAFPGAVGQTVIDLTPGRYVAVCFLPEGATPEIISQMEGPEDTPPPDAELGPPHFVLGMMHEFQVV